MYMYTPSCNISFTTEAHLKPNENFTVSPLVWTSACRRLGFGFRGGEDWTLRTPLCASMHACLKY